MTRSTNHLALIDTSVADYQTLMNAAQAQGMEVILLSGEGNGAAGLAAALEGRENIDQLHLFSHGSAGEIQLGDAVLSQETWLDSGATLVAIRESLAADGDLLIYGCDVGAGAAGAEFVERLAASTGANVAASDDVTGSKASGGDWDLEVASTPYIPAEFQASAFQGILAIGTGTLSFTSNMGLGDGVASDGEAGSTDLSGIELQIRNITDTTGSPYGSIEWFDNNFLYSNDPLYTALSSNTSDGTKGMSIVSADGTEFQIDGLTYYNWGETQSVTNTIDGYRNGTLVATTTFEGYEPSYNTTDIVLGQQFENVDEVRLYISAGGYLGDQSVSAHSLNNVQISQAVSTSPLLSNFNGDSTTFTEGGSPVLLDVGTTATITDSDSPDFDGGSLTASINSGGQASADALSVDTSGTVSLAGTTAGENVSVGGTVVGTLANTIAAGNDFVVNLNANATSARIQTLVQNLTYENDSDAPTASDRTVQVSLSDGDGGNTTGDVTVSVSGINDAPSATGVPTDVTVTEDTEGNLDLSALSLSDPDSASMTLTLTVDAGTLSTPADGAGVGGGVTETLVSDTQVTLVGSASDISTYLDTASNLRYTPAAEVSGEDQASLAIVANDGDGSGDVTLGTANIDITAVNDAPVVSGSATLTGTDEDTTSAGTAVSTLIGSLTTSDADGDTLGVAIVGASGNGTWQYSTDDGTSWTDLGTVSASSATLLDETDQVRYDPDGANGETAALTLRGWDQAAGASGDTGVDTTTNGGTTAYSSGTTTAGITVSEIDDAPTLSASRQDPTYVEGAAASDLFSGISATTVDIGESFTGLSLTVTNISDGASEVLSFDGSDIALTNGNSVTTSTNGLSVNVSVSGSTATVSFAGAALTDGEMQTLVDGLGYLNTSDDPTTGSNRVVTITSVTDSGSTSNTTALSVASTVSLTAVNDAPVIGNVNGDTDSVTAGAGAQNLTELDDATVSNPDSQYFNGGFLTLTQGSGASNGNWGLDGTNATAGGDGTIAAGETISIGGLALGTVDTTDDGQGGRALTIAFDTANATSAQIQAFIQNLTFSAPSGLGNRAFALTLDDGDGTANGGDSDATASFTASVRPNPPVIDNLDGDAVSARIGTAASFDAGGDVSVSDADSSTLDGGTLTISRTAALTGDFSLSTGATADGDAIIAARETVQVGGTTMGVIKATADGQGSNDLVIDLTGAGATPANLETLLAALQFNPTDVGAHTFDVTLSDAAAGNQPATSLPSSVTLNASNPPSGGSNDPEPVPGTDEDDTFVAGDKPQNFEGGGGNDTVSYSQPMGGSKLLPQPDGTIVVERADGTRDTLSEIEHVQFGDKSFDFTVADQIENPELADQVIELYVAYFNRVPEASGLLYWLDQIKNGLSLDQTANAFFDAALQYGDQTGYGPNTSSEDLISTIYANVLGRTGDTAPNADEIEYWRDQMESGEVTRFGLIARMLGDARDFSEDVDWGWVSELLDNKLDLGHTHAITFGVNYTSPEDAITTTHDYMGGVSPEGNQQALDLVGVSFGELDG